MISEAKYNSDIAELNAEIDSLVAKNKELSRQIEWFKKQIFGQKSERRIAETCLEQLFLGELFKKGDTGKEETQTIPAHTRKKRKKSSMDGDDTGLFFDDSLPVKEIKASNRETEGLSPDEYEIVTQKITYRLAQNPVTYIILKYIRDVIKIKSPELQEPTLICPPAPVSVFEKCHADVSFLAGMIIEKFGYHQPLYRQHQRLGNAGVDVSRAWLTQLVHRCGNLLEPIFDVIVEGVIQSRVKIIDETYIKAGLKMKGVMNVGYFWPVMGGDKEIVFLYFPSREYRHLFEALGDPAPDWVILSDGYGAYKQYAIVKEILNAQCWNHSRREFIKAEDMEPDKVEIALGYIRALYAVEKKIKEQGLEGEPKRQYRLKYSKPVVNAFFQWVEAELSDSALLPQSPLRKALNYVNNRKKELQIYLNDPDVPIDTNELERELRTIPMGRKNWLFCWTEVGAKYVGIFQTLLRSCKLHGIDPYTYFVDVLQRVADHPQSEIEKLIPKHWAQHFADNPLRSDIDEFIK